ncbi:hypothetical protein C8F01DRAFT_1169656 [Mycena amicta]|nr:hypothetical protein C8F01DRAFT_1169656 [Mycena amicta]
MIVLLTLVSVSPAIPKQYRVNPDAGLQICHVSRHHGPRCFPTQKSQTSFGPAALPLPHSCVVTGIRKCKIGTWWPRPVSGTPVGR